MAISPNARIPGIVHHDVPNGPPPVFESGAILIHLAETAASALETPLTGRDQEPARKILFGETARSLGG
jgi:glutathione S-transferase